MAIIWNNEIVENGIFPNKLKVADITPVHKKLSKTLKANYRNVSILTVGSKVVEKLMGAQIGAYMEKYLSKFLCGFRKGYSTQHALLALIEKWKKFLDKKGYAGVVLLDLSKAFDTLNHSLLLAKLKAYKFSENALTLMKNYLTKRHQRTKVNNNFSSWSEVIAGVPQGSILEPLLFLLYVRDMPQATKRELLLYADDSCILFRHKDLTLFKHN